MWCKTTVFGDFHCTQPHKSSCRSSSESYPYYNTSQNSATTTAAHSCALDTVLQDVHLDMRDCLVVKQVNEHGARCSVPQMIVGTWTSCPHRRRKIRHHSIRYPSRLEVETSRERSRRSRCPPPPREPPFWPRRLRQRNHPFPTLAWRESKSPTTRWKSKWKPFERMLPKRVTILAMRT